MKALLAHPMLRGGSQVLLGYAARLLFQFAGFTLLAHALGPGPMGELAAATALILFLAPLAELGGYHLIVRDMAAGVPAPVAVGRAVALMAPLATASVLVAVAATALLLPQVPWHLMVPLAVAELVGGRLLALAKAVSIAERRLWRLAALDAMFGFTYLAAALVTTGRGGGLATWAWLSLMAQVATGLAAQAWVGFGARALGQWHWSWRQARDGLFFALTATAWNCYVDVDKIMLAWMATMAVTGVYGVGYKVAQAATLPLSAILAVAYPGVFAAGQGGAGAALRYARRNVLPWTIGYALLAATVGWMLAPWYGRLLGPGFEQAPAVIRWLMLSVLLHALQFPFADALTGLGRQPLRTGLVTGAFILNVALNLWWIPRWGWRGAAAATVCCDGVLAAALVAAVMLVPGRSGGPAPQGQTGGDPAGEGVIGDAAGGSPSRDIP
jgi:O-antigen/teichoic acid export membrane protein